MGLIKTYWYFGTAMYKYISLTWRNGCVYRAGTWVDTLRVGMIYYSAACSLKFSLFLSCSCHVPMGAIVSGPLSDGLNITAAGLTHTESSGDRGNVGRVQGPGMALMSPRGDGTALGVFHSPGRSS